MSFWPSNTNSTSKFTSSRRKLDKTYNYPLIEYGGLGAAVLSSNNENGFEWKTIYSSQQGLLRAFNDPLEIFPCTRVEDVINKDISLRQQVQHGTQFLRTHYPNLEVPIELISNELSSLKEVERQRLEFDAFQGNLLASAFCYESSKKKTLPLIFPTGSLFRDLNISPINLRKNGVLFQPNVKSTVSFDTPINQICTSSPATAFSRRDGHFMAVRTFGSLSVYDIRNQNTNFIEKDKPPYVTTEIMTVHSSETDGAKIVDMSFSNPDHSDLYVVTEGGVGFQCSQSPERTNVNRIYGDSLDSNSNFWRILGDGPSTGLITSERQIQRFDTRTESSAVEFLSYNDDDNVITSLCHANADHLFCVATTNQVMWVDDRYPSKPLLGWKHRRVYDRKLTAQCIDFQDSSLTVLSSPKHRHVSVVCVGKSGDSPLQCQLRPSSFKSPTPPDRKIVGQTLIRHTEDSLSFSLIELSNLETEDERQRFEFSWSTEVTRLDEKSVKIGSDKGKLTEREYIVVDIDDCYKSIFGPQEGKGANNEDAEAVFETLENMPFFWQRDDLDYDHIRTLYDVAYGSGKDPHYRRARSDFLSGTALDSSRGYSARRLEKLPVKDVTRGASWHVNIEETMARISPDVFGKGIHKEAERYKLFTVEKDADEEYPEAERFESEACEQVALDLSLSVDIFSSKKIGFSTTTTMTTSSLLEGGREEEEGLTHTQSEADLALTQATEKLSLSQNDKRKAPPQVEFGFLRPVNNKNIQSTDSDSDPETTRKDGRDKEAEAGEEEEEEGEGEKGEGGGVKMPLGIRLLLSEWTIGDDPDKYHYVDPYDLDGLNASQYNYHHHHSQSQSQSQSQGQKVGGRIPNANANSSQAQSQSQVQAPSQSQSQGTIRIPQSQAPPTVVVARSITSGPVSGPGTASAGLNSKRVPTVVASSGGTSGTSGIGGSGGLSTSQPLLFPRSNTQAETQTQTQMETTSSQPQPGFGFGGMGTATQVLPGPFGGRQGSGQGQNQNLGKKKVVKKRKGGF
ncbi:hypothetical protein PNOK_0107000 [Pyrrhoderma noxium]|uniref:Uncharacterized protein n=1 Tax=Pyrrhoderma noxium TaxID=2282107 RepID=A0A286UWV7_9AGAM|nr:hypothetical protein PNOK_0107000 [Pyrrhoderma noxium]